MAKNVHTIPQRLKLANLINEQYANSMFTDSQFATYATKELGFSVEGHHVRYLRDQFELPANTPAKAEEKTIVARIEYLEQHVKNLEAKLADLLK